MVEGGAMQSGNIFLWGTTLTLIYAIGAVVAFLFSFKPEVFVRLQANNLRQHYKQRAKMSDEEIDRRFKPFWFLFVIDSMSHFVNKGVEHPEEFPRLILWYRGVGYFLWASWAFAVFLLIWGFFTGGLSITR